MNYLKSLLCDVMKRTTGFDLIDSVQTRALPSVASPRPESVELTEGMHRDIITQTRHQERNHGIPGQLILDTSLYSVGDGIIAQPMTDNEDWNSLVLQLWNDWCENPDITGKFDMGELQDLACRAIDTDGEIFILKMHRNGIPYIQMLEAPLIRGGQNRRNEALPAIETDGFGRPILYHVQQGEGTVPVPAISMIHVANWHRVTSVRGLPALQRAVTPVADIQRMTALEKRKFTALSGLAATVEKAEHKEGDVGMSFGGGQKDDSDSPEVQQRDKEIAENIGGAFIRLRPGEKITPLTSDNPGANAQAFLTSLEARACQGVLPYAFSIDQTKLPGTATRLVVGKAGRYFSRRQTKLIRRMMTPIYRFFVAWQISTGKLPAIPGWHRVEWLVPKDVSVDNGRDSANARADFEAGLKSAEDIYAENGANFYDEMKKRQQQIRFVKKLAEGEGVHPGVFLSCFTATKGLSAPVLTDETTLPAPEPGTEQPQTPQQNND